MSRAALIALLFATSCSGTLPWLRGDIANHPAFLIGHWVDVEKSTPTDSSFWILQPNGDDQGMHIRRDAPGSGSPRISHAHFGYWYVRSAATGEQQLCITRRPGRDAPTCTPFVATVDSSVTPPRRTIRLAAYAGAHHTSERVLVQEP